ncbi:MAG: hypothetical protein KQH63_07835 [Desulfobulbaceae bacterium]|nr:hypothetical protein [Desulfobulbaceae bacterium]
MPLKMSLSIGKTELLVGESPLCQLQLVNSGGQELEIIQPLSGGGMPAFRVKNIATGSDDIIRSSFMESAILPTQTIAANEVITVPTPLLETIGELQVGEYLISAVYELNDGRDLVESNAVKVEVKKLSVNNLFLDSVQGATVNGVFVSTASGFPEVVAAQFELNVDGGVQMVKSVGKGALQTRPYISLPPNTAPSFGNWIAWIENDSLQFVHDDINMGLSPMGQFNLPFADGEIIPPLYVEPSSDWGVRAPGDVLVWTGGAGGKDSSMRFIQIIPMPDNVIARPGMTVNLGGERPEWMMHHARSDGSRVITFLRKNNRLISLNALVLPKQGEAEVKLLKEWTGDFVSAGATLGVDDALHVAVLFWGEKEGEQKLQVLGLDLDTKNNVTEYHQSVIPWGSTVNVEAAKVRVRYNGEPAILLRPIGGDWSVYDGGKVVPVPAPYADSKLAVDIAFFNGADIVVIGAEMSGKISVKKMDGSDLPRTII